MNFSVFWFRSLHPERLHYRRRIASTNIITLVLNSSSTMLVLMHPILWFPTLFIRFIFLVISYVQRVHTIPVAPDWLQQISNGKPHSQLLFNCSLSNCNFRWIFFLSAVCSLILCRSLRMFCLFLHLYLLSHSAIIQFELKSNRE